MKRLIIGFVLCLAVCIVAPAQESLSAEKRAEIQTEQLNKKVGLSEAQKQKIMSINIELAKQLDAVVEEGKGQDYVVEKMKEQYAERDKAYEKVLTQEQLKKYKDQKK